MPTILKYACLLLSVILAATTETIYAAENTDAKQPALMTEAESEKWILDLSSGPDWQSVTLADLVKVNSADDTWSWKEGVLYCTGKPVSVIRSKQRYKNMEMVLTWRHRRVAGNSGLFLWATDESIKRLTAAGKKGLPHGIEVQILDTGYTEHYKKRHKKPANWFTCHGDVFSVGKAKMKPFPPVGPKGSRSFPTQNRSRDVNQWNHYYVKAVNGEVRLWVNGAEVSGGKDCSPSEGPFCLEAEGAPIEFKHIKVRRLP